MERWLASEPIRARRVGLAERAWLWCRREPALAGLAGAAAVVVLTVSGLALWRVAQARELQEYENYCVNIRSAGAYLKDGNTEQALELLLRCPPQFRHWEWGRLVRQCHQAVLTIPAHTHDLTASVSLVPIGVATVAFDQDGDQLVSLGADGEAKVWETRTGRCVFSFADSTNHVIAAAFNPVRPELALGLQSGDVRVLEPDTGRLIRSLHLPDKPMLPSGTTLALALTVSDRLGPAYYQVTRLCYSADGAKLGAAASALGVWRTDSWEPVSFRPPDGFRIASLSFDRDGRSVMWTTDELKAVVLDLESQRETWRFEGTSHDAEAVFLAPTGLQVALIDSRDRVRLFSRDQSVVEAETVTGIQKPRHQRVFYSPDGSRFCTAGCDNSAHVRSAATGEEILAIPGRVMEAIFSPDSQRLVTFGTDRLPRLWELARPAQELPLIGHTSAAVRGAFSPDGRLVATAGMDGTVRLWSGRVGREVTICPWPWGPAWSPDGDCFTIAPGYGQRAVYDAQSGQTLAALRSQFVAGLLAAYMPDGSRIVTAGAEKEARIWDAHTGVGSPQARRGAGKRSNLGREDPAMHS